MDNNFNGVAPSAPVKQKTSKTLIAGMTLCAAFAIAGAVFSGYALIKPSLDKNKETVTTDTKPEEKPEEKPETTIEKSPISTAEAEAILEKYIGKNDAVQYLDFFSRYNTEGGFSESLKLENVFMNISRDEYTQNEALCENVEGGVDCYGTISFDALQSKMQAAYGDSFTLEQKDYTFGITTHDAYNNASQIYRIAYNEDNNLFVVYGPMGLGGTSSGRIIRKVVSVQKEGNNVTGQLAYSLIDVANTAWEDVNILIDTATKNLTIYNFTLSPFDGSYTLTAFEKAE